MMYKPQVGHRPLRDIILDLQSLDCQAFRNDLESNRYNKYLIHDTLYYLRQKEEHDREQEREIAKAYGLH